jgi:hypothetical protein
VGTRKPRRHAKLAHPGLDAAMKRLFKNKRLNAQLDAILKNPPRAEEPLGDRLRRLERLLIEHRDWLRAMRQDLEQLRKDRARIKKTLRRT